MTPTITLTKGLPASGKTTWAKSQITVGGKVKRVNKDDLRAMLDNAFHNKPNEKFVLDIRDLIVSKAISQGFSIIVDDTNLNPKHEAHLRELARTLKADFRVKDFTFMPLETCVERDAKREKPVGRNVITEMYNNYLHSPLQFKSTSPVQDQSLKKAIICDLDGTVALIDGRNPYDAASCMQDKVNGPVANIVRKYLKDPEYFVIFISGRDGQYVDQTMEWLKKHFADDVKDAKNVPGLIMRSPGDKRPDNIVKEELYKNHIKGRFNVELVLDDRQKVVDMWRMLGLTCLQVAPGNF